MNKVRFLREEKKVPAYLFAVYVGTNPTTLSLIENDHKLPNPHLAQRIAAALEVEVNFLWPGLVNEGQRKIVSSVD